MKFGTLIPVLTSLVAFSLSPQALAAQSAEAEVPVSKADELVGPINVPGTDVDWVLGMLEMWTGRSILRPQNLPALTLSLQLKEKVTRAEAIQAVETLLNLNGMKRINRRNVGIHDGRD